ncbi:MAG: restriction endonuclease subunit R [Chitinophagaceae bacterium]
MIDVQFPEPVFRLKKENNTEWIFDDLRRQWLVLTNEEWVRQNFVQYLSKVLQYPAAFIAIEKEIRLGELRKRFDLLVYNSQHEPWMMIECKGQGVPLNDGVLQQALRYNVSVPVSYIAITNGHQNYCWQKKEGQLVELTLFPEWK